MEGCPGVSVTRAAMQVHFVHRNVHDTVVILEEGNVPLTRCPRCDLQVSRKALNGRHLETSQCRTGTERKQRRLAEAELEITPEKEFHAYGIKMRAVTDFTGTGGGGPESDTQFLYCCDTAGPPLRVGVVGTHQEDGVRPGRLPGQGSTAVDRMTAPLWEERNVGLPPPPWRGISRRRG